ncbi:MAG: hypothetical protein ACI9ZV_000561 [Candidatus Azotimanducaceae bacterium]
MNCLIIGKVWPEPSSTAAGRRTLDVMTALSARGWTLHFASSAQQGAHAPDLRARGVATHIIAVNDSAFDGWIESLAPDVVIFDRFMTEEQFGWRVAQHCPEALRVLDTSDLHSLRVAREEALKKQTPLNLKNETALREIASIYRSDLTLMISEFEMDILRREYSMPDRLLAYWPFSVSLSASYPHYSDRANFVMIGSLMHPPNLDAARWCKQHIWPLIRRQLPEAELHCYGSYGDRYADELNAPKDGFHFKGRAEDALQMMANYRVNLAPLRYGAGLKGKVFDGFLTGTPTVMTPIAAEGIFTEFGWAAEDAEAFAREAVELHSDVVAWEARQKREQQVCHERFDAKLWRTRLPEVMEHAYENRHAHRESNFTGQMLRHHHHRSTEFMSRWIEAKNR